MRRVLLSVLLLVSCGGAAPAGSTSSVQGTAPSKQSAPSGSELGARSPKAGDELVAFASAEGIARLSRSAYKVDFFTLANHFESQQNLGMCGPTTSVIVLNALRATRDDIVKPRDPRLFPQEFAGNLPEGLDPVFPRYTQGVFFDDERVTQVKSKATFAGQADAEGARDPGIQLRQLGRMLTNFGLHVELRIAEDSLTNETIRQEMRDNLASPNDYVVINYQRKVLGQTGSGHISPLGAYDEASDSFLILDVNPNGKTWVWVKSSTLIEAMRTMDSVENRGYLLVSDPS